MSITPQQLRRAATDLIAEYRDDHRDNRSGAAVVTAAQMCARADLMDALADTDTGIAREYHAEQHLPLLGTIKLRAGRKIYVERPYNQEGERHGIYAAFQWRADPRGGERDGLLTYIYIGTATAGPLAMYAADSEQWYALTSRGNFGRNFACGGNWSSAKTSTPPSIYSQLMEIIMPTTTTTITTSSTEQAARIARAEAQLAAARLDILATSQEDMARRYSSQASRPIYAGQSEVCLGKSEMAAAISAETRARAELLRSTTGV